MSTPEFTAWADRRLRRLGLWRELTGRLTQEGLDLTDARGGHRVIRAEEIARLRAGVDTWNRHGPYFETRIWLKGTDKPLKLTTRQYHLNGYVPAIRGLASRLEAAQLETGISKGEQRFVLGLLAIPLLFALAVWAVPLREKPLWQGLAVIAIPVLLFIAAVFGTKRSKPLPAVSHSEFDQAVNAGLGQIG